MPLLGVVSMATIFLANYVMVCYTCRPLERNWNQPRHNTFFMTLTAVTLVILICLGTVVRWVTTTSRSKGKFLCGAVSSLHNSSKRFTLYFPDRSVQSDTITTSLGASSHMLQLMREGCSFTYPPLSTARHWMNWSNVKLKKTCPWFNTKTQDSKPGFLSWESESLHCGR